MELLPNNLIVTDSYNQATNSLNNDVLEKLQNTNNWYVSKKNNELTIYAYKGDEFLFSLFSKDKDAKKWDEFLNIILQGQNNVIIDFNCNEFTINELKKLTPIVEKKTITWNPGYLSNYPSEIAAYLETLENIKFKGDDYIFFNKYNELKKLSISAPQLPNLIFMPNSKTSMSELSLSYHTQNEEKKIIDAKIGYDLFQKILQFEKHYQDDYYVFYHGCSMKTAYFFEILSNKNSPPGDILQYQLRYCFTSEKLEEFMKNYYEESHDSWDHQEHIRKYLLPASYSLFNDANLESALHFYNENTSMNENYLDLITNFLGNNCDKDMYAKLYNKYFEEYKGFGCLAQIFIKKDKIKNFAYTATAYGKKVEINLSTILENYSNKQELGTIYNDKVSLQDNKGNIAYLEKQNRLQARVFVGSKDFIDNSIVFLHYPNEKMHKARPFIFALTQQTQ